jgi:hypothetical protein
LKYSPGRPPKPSAAVLAAILVVVACGAAHAASPVSIEAIVGLGGVVRAGRWAPFILTVENRGPAREAVLTLEVYRGSELRGTLASRTFERAVSLPARSRRRFSFAAPVAASPRPAVARLMADGREMARLEIDLRPVTVSDRIVVAVSSELAFDFLAQEGARVVYPHPENLPDAWTGWSGADLVVLRDTAFHRLSGPQTAALERWVRAGGRMVITGGAVALQLESSGLSGLLPVEVEGLVERTGLPDLARLANGAAPSGRWTLADSEPRAGATVLASDADLPIVATRSLGRGSVGWLAFDPADPRVAAWPGVPSLWRALAGDAVAVAVGDESPREPLDDPWIAPLAARSEVSFPSHGLLAAFLAAFLLPSLALLLLPRRPSPRLRAALLALLAVGAAGAGWSAFNRFWFQADDFLLEAARVEAGDGAARLSRRVAVCSPSGGDFSLALGPADIRVEDVTAVGERRPAGSLVVELGDEAVVRASMPGRYQSRLLVSDTVIPFALSADIGTEGDGTWLTVENRTGVTIRDSFLVADGKIVPLGDLAPDVRSRFVLPSDGATSAVSISDGVRRAFWERESGSIGRAGPVLAGWLDEPPRAGRLGGVPAAASVCLVTMEVDRR